MILSAFLLTLSRLAPAQGSAYLSNTNQPVADTINLDGLVAAWFWTGTNAGGYLFNSLQFLFSESEGKPPVPTFFSVLVMGYPEISVPILANLVPVDNPTNAGLHAFLPDAEVMLNPNTRYPFDFISTSGTSFQNFRWSLTDSTNSSSVDGWRVEENLNATQPGIPFFVINATAIPEPSAFALLIMPLTAILCAVSKRPRDRTARRCLTGR